MAKASYLFGYSGGRLTLAEMEQRTAWNRVHPELRRRAVALMDDCPHDLGVGNAYRSAAQQEATFRSRYTPFMSPPGLFWNGMWWRHTSGAPSAPPGRSYHEETVDSWGLAIDFLNYDPAIPWANAHAAEYGLEHLASYAGERWHFQPAEVPRSRTTYNQNPGAYPIRIGFPLPGRTTTPPPPSPPVPPPVPPLDPVHLLGASDMADKILTTRVAAGDGSIWFTPNAGLSRSGFRGLDHLELVVARFEVYDLATDKRITPTGTGGANPTWKQISEIPSWDLDKFMGPLVA